ncbi:hypothetical protein [Streptomyces sp. NPDC003717]|uniref:hypothetical protein n=1 Tax=Streptomyces sp. NPDC003717 TaxID=3154276 RepID=UPI0033BDDB94
MPARYHLRFQLRPGADTVRRSTELAQYCHDTGVGEVVLMLAAEEFFPGHPAGTDEDRLYDRAATAAGVLRDAGLGVSLNPWVTTGHADRGRRDRLGLAPMTGPDGTTATAQASFACPTWRAWLTGHYGRFARLAPRVLWLEDDFRYHNHAPVTWGGGFEPVMLDRLAPLVGRPVSRAEVVAAVTRPGPPHPWRALLQQVWHTAQTEVAALVAEAVDRESDGRTRLGLMSSLPAAHDVEGRDWDDLFAALTLGGTAHHRPHFTGYSDTPGRELSGAVWQLEHQRTLRPPHVRCEPELENWPHTAWSKSDTQTWSELVAAQLADADALLLNLHPTHCGRVRDHDRVAGLLRRARPALDHVADRAHRGSTTAGLGLVAPAGAAARVHTARPGVLDDLTVDPAPAADFLLRNGVPVTAGRAPVRALFGTAAWAPDDTEVRALLAGGLLLDGTAAHILARRGHADLLGVAVDGLATREQETSPGPYAYECAGDTVLSVNVQPALARLHALGATRVLSTIRTPDGGLWGVGRCLHTNGLGGRVGILAATSPHLLPYDDAGQRLLHTMIRHLEGPRPRLPLLTGGPHLIPHHTRTADGRHRLAVANGSADPARVRVHLPGTVTAPAAHLLAPLTEPVQVPAHLRDGVLEAAAQVPHRGWLVLEWSGRVTPPASPAPGRTPGTTW